MEHPAVQQATCPQCGDSEYDEERYASGIISALCYACGYHELKNTKGRTEDAQPARLPEGFRIPSSRRVT